MRRKHTIAALVLSALLATACGVGAPTESSSAYRGSQIASLSLPPLEHPSLAVTVFGRHEVEARAESERYARLLIAERLRQAEEVRAAEAAVEAARIELAAAEAEEARIEAEREAARIAAREAKAAAAKLVVAAKPASARTTATTVYEPPSPQSQTVRQGNTPPEYVKACESGGSYTAVNPNGHYGAWQFSQSTWNGTARSAGRSDLVGVRPDNASPSDQDAMAAKLWAGGAGASHWECA